MVKYDQEAAREIERNYITPEMAQQRVRTLEGLALQPGEHVLDAGCGTGLLVQELAIAVGLDGRVVGIDNSSDMLDLATKRCKGLTPGSIEKRWRGRAAGEGRKLRCRDLHSSLALRV